MTSERYDIGEIMMTLRRKRTQSLKITAMALLQLTKTYEIKKL